MGRYEFYSPELSSNGASNPHSCTYFSGIRVKRDKVPSITYSEELIFSMSATLQRTDRRHGIVGQERCHFQLDS
jgi:hypothetical protein